MRTMGLAMVAAVVVAVATTTAYLDKRRSKMAPRPLGG
jgi:hypothetical protein